MRYGRWLTGLLVAMCLGGCTALVTRQIEHPGHASSHAVEGFLARGGFQRDMLRTRQGVRIAYWIAAPRAYHVKETLQVRHNGKQVSFSYDLAFNGDPTRAPLLTPKGSVLLLHPWGMNGAAMMMWGLHFAAAGYQVVMPDLRSQGDSSDAPVGYGPREAGDMLQLVRQLQAQHRLPGPLYLLGASYGATVALFAAPRLPDLRGVMALEPYADAADVIRRAPRSGLFGYRWLAHWITPNEVNAAIARASRTLGVDLQHVDPAGELAQTPACTLILRGSRDVLIPGDALADLSRHSARASDVEVSGEGHLTLPLRTDRLFAPLLAWMQALPTAAGSCPAFSLPPPQQAVRPTSARAAAKAPLRR